MEESVEKRNTESAEPAGPAGSVSTCPLGSQKGRTPDVDDLLRLALDIGEEMLKCGGTVHRVEDTIERILHAYGASHVEVFVIPSLINASVRMPDQSYSLQIRRAYGSTNDLRGQESMNRISRVICRTCPPLDEVEQMIREAKAADRQFLWLYLLGNALGAGAFAVFFGGTLRDGIAGTLIGALIGGALTLLSLIRSDRVTEMARSVMISFLAGVLSYLSVMSGLGQNVDSIMIGTIMLLIPGLSLGNSIRDMLSGDTIAGLLKFVQACLTAGLIALGFFLATVLMGGIA